MEYHEPMNNSIIKALHGIVFFRQGNQEDACTTFSSALEQAEMLLQENDQYIFALDAKAIALTGLALCNPSFPLSPAIETFRKLREVTVDEGHVSRRLLLLNLLSPTNSSANTDTLNLIQEAASGR